MSRCQFPVLQFRTAGFYNGAQKRTDEKQMEIDFEEQLSLESNVQTSPLHTTEQIVKLFIDVAVHEIEYLLH